MKKVFHDLHRWKKRWFRKLGAEGRDIWNWVLDAVYEFHGIWEVDLDAIEFDLGYPVSLDRIREVFKGRMYDIGDGKVFFPGAIIFQHGELSEDCNPHKPIIRTLKNRGLWEIYLKELNSTGNSNSNSSVTVMNKNKNKNKAKDKEGGVGETNGPALSPKEVYLSLPLITRDMLERKYGPLFIEEGVEEAVAYHSGDPGVESFNPTKWAKIITSWLIEKKRREDEKKPDKKAAGDICGVADV